MITMLFDSNIIIYSSQQHNRDLLRFILSITHRSVSIVSYIEALGYHSLVERERQSLELFFQDAEILPLTDTIAQQAVTLRQQRRMGLGDAIIAATAMTHNLTLVTHNTEDFRWIVGLELLDPLTNNP